MRAFMLAGTFLGLALPAVAQFSGGGSASLTCGTGLACAGSSVGLDAVAVAPGMGSPTTSTRLIDDTGKSWTIQQILAASTATAAAFAGVPTTGTSGTALASGGTVTWTPSGATGYVALHNGTADQGSRVAAPTGALPALIPAVAGTYTVKAYAAPTGGSALATSASITAGAAYATTYTSALSASAGSVGTAFNVVMTPATGGWTSATVSVGTSGAAASVGSPQTPAAGSAAAITISVTPTAAGTVVVTPTVSGMTTTPTTRSYVASAASRVNTVYTARNAPGTYIGWPTSLTLGAYDYTNSNNGGYSQLVTIQDSGGATPGSVPLVGLSASSTVPPVSGAAGGECGLNAYDCAGAGLYSNQASYPNAWQNGQIYIWKNGRTGVTRTLYVWFQIGTADSWTLLTNADGTPFAYTVTYP